MRLKVSPDLMKELKYLQKRKAVLNELIRRLEQYSELGSVISLPRSSATKQRPQSWTSRLAS